MTAVSGIFPTEVESDYQISSEARQEINVPDPSFNHHKQACEFGEP